MLKSDNLILFPRQQENNKHKYVMYTIFEAGFILRKCLGKLMYK